MTKQAIFIDGRKNNYLIQKEKEKLSIIPAKPVKINQESYSPENFEQEDELFASGQIRYCSTGALRTQKDMVWQDKRTKISISWATHGAKNSFFSKLTLETTHLWKQNIDIMNTM